MAERLDLYGFAPRLLEAVGYPCRHQYHGIGGDAALEWLGVGLSAGEMTAKPAGSSLSTSAIKCKLFQVLPQNSEAAV